MLSFLTVNVDMELEMLVVTSTMLDDVFTGIFVKGLVTGFVVVGLGLVAPTVNPTVDDNNGFVLSVVVTVLFSCSGLVVLVVVLAILVGFGLVVVDSDGLNVVVLPSVVVLVIVVGLTVVDLIVDVFVDVVVFGVVLRVVVLAVVTV